MYPIQWRKLQIAEMDFIYDIKKDDFLKKLVTNPFVEDIKLVEAIALEF